MTTALPTPAWASLAIKPESVGKPKSMLFYGFPGRRKTSILASIIELAWCKKVLYIDVDNGSEVLGERYAKEIASGALTIIPIDSLNPNAIAQIAAIVEDITTTNYGYDAVALDTLDVGQDAVEKALKLKYADSKNTFGVYGDLGVWTDEICRKLHNCPWFVALIAAHAKEQTKESGAYRVTPKLSGSSKDSIASIFSIVAYVDFVDVEGERRLLCTVGEDEHYITKNRFGLDPYIGDVTMPKLYGMIEAGATKPAVSAVKAAA